MTFSDEAITVMLDKVKLYDLKAWAYLSGLEISDVSLFYLHFPVIL